MTWSRPAVARPPRRIAARGSGVAGGDRGQREGGGLGEQDRSRGGRGDDSRRREGERFADPVAPAISAATRSASARTSGEPSSSSAKTRGGRAPPRRCSAAAVPGASARVPIGRQHPQPRPVGARVQGLQRQDPLPAIAVERATEHLLDLARPRNPGQRAIAARDPRRRPCQHVEHRLEIQARAIDRLGLVLDRRVADEAVDRRQGRRLRAGDRVRVQQRAPEQRRQQAGVAERAERGRAGARQLVARRIEQRHQRRHARPVARQPQRHAPRPAGASAAAKGPASRAPGPRPSGDRRCARAPGRRSRRRRGASWSAPRAARRSRAPPSDRAPRSPPRARWCRARRPASPAPGARARRRAGRAR